MADQRVEMRAEILHILRAYWPEAGGQTAGARFDSDRSAAADAIMVHVESLFQQNAQLRGDFGTVRARLLALVDFAEERRDG